MFRFAVVLVFMFCLSFEGEAQSQKRKNPFEDEGTQEDEEKKFSKKEVKLLKKYLSKIGLRYSSKYSASTLLKKVEGKKKAYTKMRFSSGSQRLIKFSKFYDWGESLGGYSYFANKDAQFGTKTSKGYFKEKVGDKYLFVYGVQKRGHKNKRYRLSARKWVTRYLYQCRVKKYSYSQLPKKVLAQVDPRKAQDLFNKDKSSRLKSCEKLIGFLES